ncbi:MULTISPECIES: chemotaxis protein CheW [Cyanophyceae]|uniref:Chemotaxis protein CheW n=1 Tax=Leptolyngbya subtilissima DQ-A4 TaxID=2933933 RepID=A0ABV0K071_9CYAN|nr:chemotaxis protein CheW [Nodosilinea sp. FACHB-141]MBD2110955.1 chemotaxis protein CheW [Nodosilinea sp. FACHB-141]
MNSETATPTDNLIPPLQDTTSPGAPPEEQFLKVIVNGGLPLLLPGANLVEIMKLSIGQVVPMFQMAPWVMGLYNWRGEMLWVADLGHFLGFTPWYNQAEAATRHTVVVIKPPYRPSQPTDEQTATLGLVVNAVEAMVAYPVPALQPLSAAFSGQSIPVEPGLLPFLRGCCVDSADQPQLILDGTAVLNAMAQA